MMTSFKNQRKYIENLFQNPTNEHRDVTKISWSLRIRDTPKNRVELKRKAIKSNILDLIIFFFRRKFYLIYWIWVDVLFGFWSMHTIVLLSRLLFAFHSVKYSLRIQYNHRLRLTFLLTWISRWLPRNVRSSLQSHDTFVLV